MRRNGILSSEPRGTGILTMLLGQPLGITTSQRRDCRCRRRHWNSCFIDGIGSADLRNGRMACTRLSLSLSHVSLMASGVQISGMEEWHAHEIFSLPLSLSGCLSVCKTMEDQQKLIGIYHHITATICLFSVQTGLLIHVQLIPTC